MDDASVDLRQKYLQESLALWEWIAEEPGRTKLDYFNKYELWDIQHNCFLCEYRKIVDRYEFFNCNEPCLVDWVPSADEGRGHYFRCEWEYTLYHRWTKVSGMYWLLPKRPYLAQRLARGIVNLHRDALGLPHTPLWVPPEHRNRCDTEQRTSV